MITANVEELVARFRLIAASTHQTEGQWLEAFEASVTDLIGGYAVAFNSCGSGLFATLCQYKQGLWIVPNNTFYATGAMAKMAGKSVCLADCGEGTPNLTVNEVRYTHEKNPHATGVIMTHVGGMIAEEYAQISQYCDENSLTLIEDGAHVFGAVQMDSVGPVVSPGSLSDAVVFSFYPTKAIPVGEGGVVVTKHRWLYEALCKFRNYGKHQVDGAIRYDLGMNLRMDEWTAAVADLQVTRYSEIIDARGNDAVALSKILNPWVGRPTCRWGNWYKYIVRRDEAEALKVTRFTGHVYQESDQLQTALQSIAPDEVHGYFPNSRAWANEYVCLPIGEGMYADKTSEQILAFLQGGEL